MTPEIKFPQIPANFPYDADEIARNMGINDMFGFGAPDLPHPSTTIAAIIGGGPSLQQIAPGSFGRQTRLQSLDSKTGYFKILAGSAYRLVEQGVLKNGADAAIINSPDPLFADVIAHPRSDLSYWLASYTAPAVIEKLATARVSMWDAYIPEIDYEGRKGPVIGSGTTAPLAAAALLIQMGVKQLEFFGVDGGSFAQAINYYASYTLQDILEKIPVKVLNEHVVIDIGGKPMKVATNFWSQAEEMELLIKANPDVKFTFHGDSLNNRLFNQGEPYNVVFDPRPPKDTVMPASPQRKPHVGGPTAPQV